MKERLVGVIELHPFMRWNDTGELEIEGYNCNEVYITLKVKLPESKTARLNTLSCAIRRLKRLFLEIKKEVEEDIERHEEYARGW